MNDKDMKIVARYLVAGERPVKIWRHHWMWWLEKSLLIYVITLALLAGSILTQSSAIGIAFVIGLLVSTLMTMDWRRRVFFVSNMRVGLVGGVVSKAADSDVASLSDIQNIDESKRWLAGLLGYSTYILQTGQGSIVLRGFPSGIDRALWQEKHGTITGDESSPDQPRHYADNCDDDIIVH